MNSKIPFTRYQQHINQALERHLQILSPSEALHEAIRYAVLGEGKRVRPLLIYILGEALGLTLEQLDHAACSVELLHTYSLIHDDLPSMDNDDWRRGKPSCHRKFGEALALLAGDALQIMAFNVLLKALLRPSQIVKMLAVLTKAAGPCGMIRGQAMELSEQTRRDKSALETVYRLKTGTLFSVSLEFPGIIANLPSKTLAILAQIGGNLGLAYQIQDNIFDQDSGYQPDLDNAIEGLKTGIFDDLVALFPSYSQIVEELLSFILPIKSIANIYH